MFASRAFRGAAWVLLIFLIILVGSEISFVFTPVLLVVGALFWPVIIAGLLYYWFCPVVDWLTSRRLPRALAILFVYVFVATLLGLIATMLVPLLRQQLASLIGNAPLLIRSLRERLLALEEHEWISRFFAHGAFTLEEMVNQLTLMVNNMLLTAGQHMAQLFEMTTNVVTTLVLIPFLLFYMLLDGHRLPEALVSWLPRRHRSEVKSVLYGMDRALSTYIQGQALVSLSVGVLALIGYVIIGINYSLVLAIITTVTNIVPFVGPIIGTLPALIVGIIHSPGMAWRALLVMIIVQQIESLLISPRIMGKKFASHPVAIILVILAAGQLAGFVGVLLAIPAYAVLRVVLSHSYMLVRLLREPAKPS